VWSPSQHLHSDLYTQASLILMPKHGLWAFDFSVSHVLFPWPWTSAFLPPAFTLVSCSAYSTVKTWAICSSETSVDFQRYTRRYIPEDSTLQYLYWCEVSSRCRNWRWLLQMAQWCGRTALLVQVAWLLAVSVCSSPTPWERANASGELFEGRSPQDLGLRPGNPLDELPPPDLIESPNKMLDPRPHDLNATALRPMLGRSFDPQFMSITRPR
jgi:hypothetical protein